MTPEGMEAWQEGSDYCLYMGTNSVQGRGN